MLNDVYSSLYRQALLPTWEGVVRRRPTLEIHAELLLSEWYSPDELEHLQAQKLSRLLRHAWANVPYYQRKFAEAGVRPDDVRSLDDLAKLPLSTRAEAQDSRELRTSAAPPRPEISKSTSGSTGEPLLFGYDLGSEYWRQAVKLRGYGWAGHEPGKTTLHFWGSLDALYHKHWRKKAKVAVDRFLRREIYVDSNLRSEADLARLVRLIEKLKPHALVCFSQAAADLARYVNAEGARRWDEIRVICGAERLFPADRAELERAFGPHVFETYGSREVMLIGAECDAHAGMHLSMENLIVEILVERDGKLVAAAPGETGQVAITDLHNFGMPFIRYLCGDLATAAPRGRCACGRGLARLKSVDGRSNDTLYDADGRAVDSLFFNVMFSVLGGKVRQFQAVQKKDGSVSLRVVPAAGFDAAVSAQIDDNCRKFLRGLPLEIQLVDSIPVGPNGKRRVVVVER